MPTSAVGGGDAVAPAASVPDTHPVLEMYRSVGEPLDPMSFEELKRRVGGAVEQVGLLVALLLVACAAFEALRALFVCVSVCVCVCLCCCRRWVDSDVLDTAYVRLTFCDPTCRRGPSPLSAPAHSTWLWSQSACPPPPGFSCRKQDGAGPASVSELVDFLGVLKRFSEDQLERLNGNKANEAGRSSGSPAAHDEEVVGDAEEEHGEGGECEEMGGGYDEMESESGDEMEGACDEMEGMERGGGGRCCDAAGETFFGVWSLRLFRFRREELFRCMRSFTPHLALRSKTSKGGSCVSQKLGALDAEKKLNRQNYCTYNTRPRYKTEQGMCDLLAWRFVA